MCMKQRFAPEVFQDNQVKYDNNFVRQRKEGVKAVRKAADSSFWDWDNGSFPFFWGWQTEIQKDLCDGTDLWVYEEKLPNNSKKKDAEGTECADLHGLL